LHDVSKKTSHKSFVQDRVLSWVRAVSDEVETGLEVKTSSGIP
jgi:hypothetical protein